MSHNTSAVSVDRSGTSTAVRSLGSPGPEGLIVLSDPGNDYRDGAEERVQEILRTTKDRSSDSDEAFRLATNWPERYHLSPARANVVRPLALPPQARVLEIGAGCGAITRYLGEMCAVVDALEPVPSRALAASLRTADLESVQVLVGVVGDVPREPTYDVVVVVGVLEYVGSGSPDRAPYLEFLATITDLLLPGGSLVLAIENKLGVKYLVGAPEDHSDRAFDSIEGYPGGSPARTFSRRELDSMLVEVGLQPDFKVAFPDYKMTRTVLAPAILPAHAESLLYRVPHFPSPDWGTGRQHLLHESLAWKSFVEAGLSVETGNSFVVLAGKGASSELWKTGSAGEFFSIERRPEFAVRTTIDVKGDDVTFLRRRSTDLLVTGPITLNTADGKFEFGRDFTDVFVDTADAASVELLTQWRELLEQHRGERPFPVDLVPHNLVVDDQQEIHMIDDEWRSETADVDYTMRRGILLFTIQLYHRRPNRAAWAGCATFADVALAIGSAVGVEGEWLTATVDAEAEFQQAVIAASGEPDPERVVDGLRQAFQHMLATGIRSPADFVPHADQRRIDQLAAEVGAVLERETAAHHEIGRLTGEVIEVHEHLRVTRDGLFAAQDAWAATRTTLEETQAQVAAALTALATARGETEAQRVATSAALAEQQRFEQLLDATRRTLSWRITRPLRLVRRIVTRG